MEDLQRMATAIALARQKVALIDDRIEELSTSLNGEELLVGLRTERKALTDQVDSLIAIMEGKDQDISRGIDDVWLDLRNVLIAVTPHLESESPLQDDGSTVLSSIWDSTMGPMLTALSGESLLCDIQVYRPIADDEPRRLVLSKVSRRYSEFAQLHRRLKRQFPKIGKISFPEPGSFARSLAEALQNYLTMLISDEVIQQSPLLREFVTIDGDPNASPSLPGMQTVRNVFRSATSLVGISTDTGSAVQETSFYETRQRHTTLGISEREPSHSASQPGTPQKQKAHISHSPLPISSPCPAQRPVNGPKHQVEKNPKVLLVEMESKQPAETGPRLLDEFTEEEMDMIIETIFALVNELFDLRQPTQWVRRKLLGVFKQLLKQAYGDTLNKSLTESINHALSEPALLWLIAEARNALYPEGVFIKNRPPPLIRSEEQKYATMIEARTVFLRRVPDFVQNLAGRYNAICGMTRIFNALQSKELNKTLIYANLDIVLKLFFTENA